MSYSNFPRGFPQGITVRGMPLQQAYPGKVFWVHNDTGYTPDGGIAGNNGNPGTYQKPFSTIDYAISQCSSGRGDIIMVMPGYTETLSAAAAITLDVDHVAIVGLGAGKHRPKLSFSNTAADVEVDNPDCALINLVFESTVADCVRCIDVDAQDTTIEHCLFTPNASGNTFNISIDIDADGTYIANSVFQFQASYDTGAVPTDIPVDGINFNVADRTIIINNVFMGDFTSAAIAGAAGRGVLIADNTIHNIATENIAGAIDLDDGVTGMVARNTCCVLNTTAGPAGHLDLASCANVENYSTDTVGETVAGALVGTAAT